MVATVRDELHRLADALPTILVDELSEVVRIFERQLAGGPAEEVTDPEEAAIVGEALHDDAEEAEYTFDEAKSHLARAAGRERPDSGHAGLSPTRAG